MRKPLDRRALFWPALLAGGAIVVVSPVSFGLAAAMLVGIAIVYEVRWWMPWALGLVVLAALPAVTATGAAERAASLAAVFVVLGLLTVALLALEQRKRQRSGER